HQFLRDEDRRIYEEMRRLEATAPTLMMRSIAWLEGFSRRHVAGNMCHRGTNFLTEKYVGHTVSLRIVAGEGIPCEHSPTNIPRRQVTEEKYHQRQVAEESPELSPGNGLNVVVQDTSVQVLLVGISKTRLRRARNTVRLKLPMSASMEACIARHAAALTPSLPVPSPLLPLPSPLTPSPTDVGAPLGYKETGIKMRALLLFTSRKTDIPEADMPPQKRACLTTLALGFEAGEKLDTNVRQMTKEFEVRFDETQDDQAFLRARVNTMFRDRPFHRHTVLFLDREATYAHREWASSEDMTLGRIEILEARDPEPQEGPAEAGSIKRDADMSRDGDDIHGSRTSRRRQVPTQRGCTYTDFLKCQPMKFKGSIACENLNKDSCVFAVSSGGKRCVLEKSVQRSGEEVFVCSTSQIDTDKLTNWIETDKCLQARGLNCNVLGISSDSLLESNFTQKLCSTQCYNSCPNIVDLYFNLAAGEGVYLPSLCQTQGDNKRKGMSEIRSFEIVAPEPVAPVKL
nr:hypothetical protein [Tanacetum cinerariifolium]